MFQEDAYNFLLQEFATFLKQTPESRDENANTHLLDQIKNHNPYLSMTATYPQIYDALKTLLTTQKNVFSWDYLAFFEENYPKPNTSD